MSAHCLAHSLLSTVCCVCVLSYTPCLHRIEHCAFARTVHPHCIGHSACPVLSTVCSPSAAPQSNRLRPGDEGYNYDVRADFPSPTADNDWDDSGGAWGAVYGPA